MDALPFLSLLPALGNVFLGSVLTVTSSWEGPLTTWLLSTRFSILLLMLGNPGPYSRAPSTESRPLVLSFILFKGTSNCLRAGLPIAHWTFNSRTHGRLFFNLQMSEGGWGRLQKVGGGGLQKVALRQGLESQVQGWTGLARAWLPGWERPTQVDSPGVWIRGIHHLIWPCIRGIPSPHPALDTRDPITSPGPGYAGSITN